jgi:hypothetical protein
MGGVYGVVTVATPHETLCEECAYDIVTELLEMGIPATYEERK